MTRIQGWKTYRLPFDFALKAVKRVVADPYKHHTKYWRNFGVKDITPKSLDETFQKLNRLESILPNPIRRIKKERVMYGSYPNPFALGVGFFGRHTQVLLDYQDDSTVIGKLVRGEDSAKTWLNCYLYDTSAIEDAMRDLGNDAGVSQDNVEAIVCASDNKADIAELVEKALSNLESRIVKVNLEESFLDSLY